VAGSESRAGAFTWCGAGLLTAAVKDPKSESCMVLSALAAPRRTSICLDCRTALTEGETCDGGPRHRVVSLTTLEGRAKLLDEVWGPPSVRRRAKQLAKAGGGGAGLGAIFDGCSDLGCDAVASPGDLIGAILVGLVVTGVFVLLSWVGMK